MHFPVLILKRHEIAIIIHHIYEPLINLHVDKTVNDLAIRQFQSHRISSLFDVALLHIIHPQPFQALREHYSIERGNRKNVKFGSLHNKAFAQPMNWCEIGTEDD